jgi:hypothetical protein
MPLPSGVQITSVKHSFLFNRDGSQTQITKYTYFVGNFGPFYINAYAAEDNEAHINKVINDQVLLLRSTGAIT